MEQVCGTCEYNNVCEGEFCCNNPDSDAYGCPTNYNDVCEEWEEKE